jgi:hypothetical protein
MKHIGNISSFFNEQFVQECTSHAKKFNPGYRTFEEVLEQTIAGEAIEVLVCNELDLIRVDFNVSEYDAISKSGKKYEIKHTVKDSDWWNFKTYDFFLKNSHNLDYIVLCYLNKETNDAHLKWIANAKTFNKYVQSSKFNSGQYYNNKLAIKENQCITF